MRNDLFLQVCRDVCVKTVTKARRCRVPLCKGNRIKAKVTGDVKLEYANTVDMEKPPKQTSFFLSVTAVTTLRVSICNWKQLSMRQIKVIEKQ